MALALFSHEQRTLHAIATDKLAEYRSGDPRALDERLMREAQALITEAIQMDWRRVDER